MGYIPRSAREADYEFHHRLRVTIHPMSQSAAYAPSPEFVRNANVQGMEGYRALYERAKEDPQAFWGELAEKEIEWFQKWDRVLDWSNRAICQVVFRRNDECIV